MGSSQGSIVGRPRFEVQGSCLNGSSEEVSSKHGLLRYIGRVWAKWRVEALSLARGGVDKHMFANKAPWNRTP